MKTIAATCLNPVQQHSSSRSARSKPLVGRGRRTMIGSLSAALILLAVQPESAMAASAAPGVINAIGVENEYADVIAQIGGKYVQVSAIITDPNTDPHTFEVNPKVAAQVASADLIVKNGVGYDAWADKIIAAAPNGKRKVIDTQHLLGLPDNTSNPHLWPLVRQAKANGAPVICIDPLRTRTAAVSDEQSDRREFEAAGADCNVHARRVPGPPQLFRQ